VIQSQIDRLFETKVMKGKTFVVRKSSNKQKYHAGWPERIAGCVIAFLRGEALFFLDFLWLLSLIKQRTRRLDEVKVTKSQENGLLLKYWPITSWVASLKK
jgi:hypothetical protein